jgi:hypothetical protein
MATASYIELLASSSVKRVAAIVALAAAVFGITLLSPDVAAAQGCSLCYQSAAAAGSRAIHALHNGIVILIVPPFFICCAITYLAFRRNAHLKNN